MPTAWRFVSHVGLWRPDGPSLGGQRVSMWDEWRLWFTVRRTGRGRAMENRRQQRKPGNPARAGQTSLPNTENVDRGFRNIELPNIARIEIELSWGIETRISSLPSVSDLRRTSDESDSGGRFSDRSLGTDEVVLVAGTSTTLPM